jgi:hypothetical protein
LIFAHECFIAATIGRAMLMTDQDARELILLTEDSELQRRLVRKSIYEIPGFPPSHLFADLPQSPLVK